MAEAVSLNYGARSPFKSDGIFVKTTEYRHLHGAILQCELWVRNQMGIAVVSQQSVQLIHLRRFSSLLSIWRKCSFSVSKVYVKESKRHKPKCELSKQCVVYVRWVTQECPCLQSDWLDICHRKILLWGLTFRSPALSSCEMHVLSPRHLSVEFSCPVCPLHT